MSAELKYRVRTATLFLLKWPTNKTRGPVSFHGLLEVVSVGFGMATLTGFLGKLWWIFELSSHFPLHLAAASALFALVWAMMRRWRWAAFLGTMTGINALLVLLLLWPAHHSASSSGKPLRLVALNVHTENQHTDLVLEYLQRIDADVVLLMEVDQQWMTALKPLSNSYPEIIAHPREDNFGIALLCRVSSTNSSVIYLGQSELPTIVTTLRINGQSVTLLGTHPLPPGSAEYSKLRNDQLRAIAVKVKESGLPSIVLGDLNTTPWSPYFAQLLRESGLVNTSQGRGLYGTWPAWLPLARIPLDHCLISPDLKLQDKQLGPQVGSDHLPVVIELQVPTP